MNSAVFVSLNELVAKVEFRAVDLVELVAWLTAAALAVVAIPLLVLGIRAALKARRQKEHEPYCARCGYQLIGVVPWPAGRAKRLAVLSRSARLGMSKHAGSVCGLLAMS